MDSLPDPRSCKPAPVRSQNSCSVVDSLDSEGGLRTLLGLALHRMSARLALRGHAPGPVALAQNHPAAEQEWQSEPLSEVAVE